MEYITLPVESHVFRFLLANQEEEHYFLSEADPFGMYLLRLLIENPVERRRDEQVAAYPERWPVQLGSYEAWGIGEPSGKVAYLFNSYINKFLLRDLHGFVQQAVEDGKQAKHAIQGFMVKYGLREEDIQFETLQKSWQRYWSTRKNSKKKRVSLTGQLPLKELEKRLLKTSAQAPNPGLAGYVAAYYLPQADLAADPVLASPGLVSADLQLLPGAGWRALPYTTHTLKLEETPKTERGVTTYQVRATAQRPQPSPGVLATLASLDRRPLLLLLVEAGGGRRLVGSREEYLLLSTTGEGQNPASKSGLELRFEGAATRRAPYYQGAVPVLDGSALPPLAGTGGYVEIRDKRGNLMARVPAGTVVTVASGFRVVLSY